MFRVFERSETLQAQRSSPRPAHVTSAHVFQAPPRFHGFPTSARAVNKGAVVPCAPSPRRGLRAAGCAPLALPHGNWAARRVPVETWDPSARPRAQVSLQRAPWVSPPPRLLAVVAGISQHPRAPAREAECVPVAGRAREAPASQAWPRGVPRPCLPGGQEGGA